MKRLREPGCAARWLVFATLVLATALATACVEPFRGSNIQISLQSGVPTPPPEGTDPPLGAPPANTFLSFYAVEFTLQRDDDGDVVLDGTGQPIIVDSFTFHVTDFELRPIIDTSSPCFIEVDNTEFPGLHVTQFASRLGMETGIADPLAPPPGTDPGAITDMLDASRRMALLPALQGTVKALTSASQNRYPALAAACVEDGGDTTLIPPPSCIGDESNQVRLDRCRAFWQAHPEHYEGNDKVFTIPLAGDFFGTVDGINPVNMGLIGGAGMFTDAVLVELDSLLVNWQFKDLDSDGQPDYPAGTPPEDRSDIGFPFMQGLPVHKTRGVLNVPLQHPTVTTISGEAVIFPDLGEDEVTF